LSVCGHWLFELHGPVEPCHAQAPSWGGTVDGAADTSHATVWAVLFNEW